MSNTTSPIINWTTDGDTSFSLAKHPKLIDIVKEKEITVEVCPIS